MSRVQLARLFARFAKTLAALALFQICGGHWALLQSVAWVGMVISYSQEEASLPEALEKTFDGAHPCTLCKVVRDGKSDEQRQEETRTVAKLDAVLAPTVGVPRPVADEFDYSAVPRLLTSLRESPPTPPPLV